MLRSLDRAGRLDRFDLFLLSDTTDPAIAAAEETAWAALRRRFGAAAALHYRRRPANIGRKAGNIADFCRRWGARYDFMVVLDADSIMTAAALAELVRAMEANPRAGLIQTVPLPARRTTLFGRCIQFAGCLYGPATGGGAGVGGSAIRRTTGATTPSSASRRSARTAACRCCRAAPRSAAPY